MNILTITFAGIFHVDMLILNLLNNFGEKGGNNISLKLVRFYSLHLFVTITDMGNDQFDFNPIPYLFQS